jgi:hypothetical protein
LQRFLATNPEALPENLGHEKVMTTFLGYGEVACPRQGEIMRGLATPQQAGQSDLKELAEELLRQIRDSSEVK